MLILSDEKYTMDISAKKLHKIKHKYSFTSSDIGYIIMYLMITRLFIINGDNLTGFG